MNCKRTAKYLALYGGDELSRRRSGRVSAHLRACPACRREAGELAATLGAAKALAHDEEVADWSEREWNALMRRVSSSRIEPKNILAGVSWKPVFAGAMALLLIASGTFFVVLKKSPSPAAVQTALQTPSQILTASAQPPAGGDDKSKTIVSKDGLKIIWFYNKNFQGEDYGK
jgi:anti-sigma factor RsiW